MILSLTCLDHRQKTENQLGEVETVSQQQLKVIEDLTRKVRLAGSIPVVAELTVLLQVDDLTPRAEEATRLKDKMDEYRHAAEKAKKHENALEKYKKKLEEQADLRRSLKVSSLSCPKGHS